MTERRKPPPVVLGAKMHPAYDSPTPPAPAPERVTRPWPPMPAPPAPPTPPRASFFPRTGPQWAVGVATVITALGTTLGGVFYAFSQYRKDTAEASVAASTAIETQLRSIDARITMILEDQLDRDLVNLAVLCQLNNGPPARNVRCPPNACEPQALDANKQIIPGQPLCRATAAWPPVRR